MANEDATDEVNERIVHYIYERISDRQKVREYKKLHGSDGRLLLAQMHEEVRSRSLGEEGAHSAHATCTAWTSTASIDLC